MTILSSREWATIIWFFVFLVFLLIKQFKSTGKILGNIFKIFFEKKFMRLWEIYILYIVVTIFLISKLPFWNIIFIKDIAIWTIFSGFYYYINATSRESDETYISTIIKKSFKLTIIIEFIISSFTFSLFAEIIIIPIAMILTASEHISGKNEKYNSVHKALEILIAIFGLFLAYKTLENAIYEYKNLNVINTFISFIIPIVYLFICIPLIYSIELYAKYEVVLLRLKIICDKNMWDYKSQRRLLFIKCKFSIRKINLFQKHYLPKLYTNISYKEFVDVFNDFKA